MRIHHVGQLNNNFLKEGTACLIAHHSCENIFLLFLSWLNNDGNSFCSISCFSIFTVGIDCQVAHIKMKYAHLEKVNYYVDFSICEDILFYLVPIAYWFFLCFFVCVFITINYTKCKCKAGITDHLSCFAFSWKWLISLNSSCAYSAIKDWREIIFSVREGVSFRSDRPYVLYIQ